MITVRAKSTIKLNTGQSNLNHEYPAGISVEVLAKDMLHAVVCNKGTAAAKEYFESLLAKYNPRFEGLEAGASGVWREDAEPQPPAAASDPQPDTAQ